MLTKENLLHFMIKGHIHLSKKDYGFFNNIIKIIQEKNQITTNQNKLFDKLIVKYQRQFKKLNYDLSHLQQLKWTVEVVETKQSYLTPKISLVDNTLIFQSPFNPQFLNDFKRMDDNVLSWDKVNKIYKGPFYTHNFKKLNQLVIKHFDNIEYCPEIQKLLEIVKNYDELIFNPTLVKIHDHYYIAAINEHLSQAIQHIELNDFPKTLYELSQYGVEISYEITKGNELLKFASDYMATTDLENLSNLIEWLKLLDIKQVFTYREIIYNKQITAEVSKILAKNGIKNNFYDKDGAQSGVLIKSTTAHNLGASDYKRCHKIIHLKNYTPLKIL